MQAGPVVVDVCQGGCGGIWFDAFELQKVDERKEAGANLLHITRDERIQVDPDCKRECPRCPTIKLSRHFFSARRRVQVDECPNCGGYWLDYGELGQIREELHAAEITERPGQVSMSMEVIRYLYRLETGQRDG
jgi:Zn-finger nucleic acid-binding protein